MRLSSLIAHPKSHSYEWQSWYHNPSLLIPSQVAFKQQYCPSESAILFDLKKYLKPTELQSFRFHNSHLEIPFSFQNIKFSSQLAHVKEFFRTSSPKNETVFFHMQTHVLMCTLKAAYRMKAKCYWNCY